MKTAEEFAVLEAHNVGNIKAMIAMEEARIADRRRELKEAEERAKYFAMKATTERLMKMVADLPPYDEADHDDLVLLGAAVN